MKRQDREALARSLGLVFPALCYRLTAAAGVGWGIMAPRPAFFCKLLPDTTRSARAAQAWFLHGGKPEDWLTEALRCGADEDALEFCVFPGHAGALMIPGESAALRTRPAGVAFVRAGAELWVPADARIAPPLSVREMEELCGADTLVWHPACGLVLFTPAQRLRSWQLISLPDSPAEPDWNAAVPVEPVNRTIQSVSLLGLWDDKDVYGGAEQEIGTEPPPDLPSWRDEKERSQRGIGRMLDRLAGRGPGKNPGGAGARPPAGPGPLARWFGKVSDSLQKKRWQAMDKLLRDLEKDPDKALRRAIPFVRNPHRGLAAPGGELRDRMVEFSMEQLGASGAVDSWDLPPDYQMRLRQQYLNLALREKQLGRFRRAAFIYSNLLGDLSAGATALKEGGFHREAAIIYRTFLQNPEAAARCLRDGGLHADAAALFSELKLWKDAAECYETLGLNHRAAACWRLAVEDAAAKGDRLLAAAMLERRLDVPQEALAMLRGAWPSTAQAITALTAEFDLCARLGWHGEARGRLAVLRPDTSAHAEASARLFTALARAYPDAPVRTAAREAALLRLSALLGGDAAHAAAAARILPELAAGDVLLPRDASRHVAAIRRREEEAARAAAARDAARRVLQPPSPGKTLTVEWTERRVLSTRRFRIGQVLAAATRGSHWYVLAESERGDEAVLLRGSWLNAWMQHGLYWSWRRMPHVTAAAAPQIVPGPGGMVVIADRFDRISGVQIFPADDSVREREAAGSPDWLGSHWYRLAADRQHWWAAVDSSEFGEGVRLSCHDAAGRISASQVVSVPPDEMGTVSTVAVHDDHVLLALPQRVVVCRGGARGSVAMDEPITAMAVNLPGARAQVALATEKSLYHFRPDNPDSLRVLESDMANARVCFTHKGHLIAVADGGGIAAVPDDRGYRYFGKFSLPAGEIAAILPAANRTQFALITRDGTMHIGRVRGDD